MLMLLLLSWAHAACPHGSDRFNCVEFKRAYDGDTLVVDLPGVHPYFGAGAHVRVKGVDTPEMKGKNDCEKRLARIAQKLVESELGHAIRIDLQLAKNSKGKVKHEKFGRILAQVLYDKKDLAETLLRNQLAVPYEGEKKKAVDWCKLGQKYLK